MRLRFYGAAQQVTGSCHILEAGGRRILLDCGLFQGSPADEAGNRAPFPFDPRDLDAVVLSHAHIDHSGRIPLLIDSGFDGPVYAHAATRDLCRVMLRDSGFLQEKEAETENRKRERKGLAPVEPLYTMRDAEDAMRHFDALAYEETREILSGIEVCLRDAGHILGSAIVEVKLTEEGRCCRLVFSGDLGQRATPILRDPARVRDADVVLLESTYGDRLHRSREETQRELGEIFREALRGRGNILIPAFAVGRTQEILYLFAENAKEWGLDRWRIYLDSPLAIDATEVYTRHVELYDAEAARLWRRRGMASMPRVSMTRSTDESIALNRIRSGAIIIAGSGMCTGGRIKHHLKNNLWRKECHVVIVGYQAHGTLGRQLVEGRAYVRLWGETVKVAAKIHTVGGLSAHADRDGLASWYSGFQGHPPVFLVHGEDHAQHALAALLQARFGAKARAPGPGTVVELDKYARPA